MENTVSKTKKLIQPVIKTSILIAVPIWTMTLIWAPQILEAFLGKEWVEVTPYFRALSIPGFIIASSGWLDRIYDVIKKQKWLFLMELLFSILMIISIFIARIFTKQAIEVVYVMSFVTFLYGWIWLAGTYRLLRLPLSNISGLIKLMLLATLPITIMHGVLQYIFNTTIAVIASTSILAIYMLYSYNYFQVQFMKPRS